jgi:hypothetical protein
MSTGTYVPDSSSATAREERAGGGWITFAGVMIVIVATLNIIDGIRRIPSSPCRSSPSTSSSSTGSSPTAGGRS